MSVTTISPQELKRLMATDNQLDFLDVRTPVEYREVHAIGTRNVPLDRLDPTTIPTGKRVYVICRTGGRGQKACERLRAAGRDAVNVEGGTLAWEQCGLPVERGKKAMSLERQVRIAAGLLVLLGVGLGWFVHPGFLGLAAFVGAGLVFAGLTDTCGMGMLLARMPWNRVASSTCSA